MKEEIVAGLRNAMDRGYPLEQAAQSFINAGYNSKDIEEAANYLSQGAINVITGDSNSKASIKNSAPTAPFSTPQPITQAPQSSQNYQDPRLSSPNREFPISSAEQSPQPVQMLKKESGKGKKVIITLVIVLVVLVAILLLSMVFKEKILMFLGK